MVHSSWYEEFQNTIPGQPEQLSVSFVASMNYDQSAMNCIAATMNHDLLTMN